MKMLIFFEKMKDMKNRFTYLVLLICFFGLGMQSVSAQVQSENKQIIRSIEGDKSVEITLENDVLTELKIDGEIIPEEQYDNYQDIVGNLRSDNHGKFDNNSNQDQKMYSFPEAFDMNNLDSLMNSFGGMAFDFENMPNLDSLMNGLDMQQFNFDAFDQGNMNQMLEDMMQQFGGQSFNFDDDFMQNLQEQMEGFSHMMPEGFEELLEGFNFGAAESTGIQRSFEEEMLKDGLIENKSEYEFDLSGKKLEINGEKQDDATWLKYKNIYEDATGEKLDKKSHIQFHKNSSSQNKTKKPKTYKM